MESKRGNKLLVFIAVFLINAGSLVSQIDTAFWFAAPWVTPDHTERNPVVMHISTFGTPLTTVRLRQPAALAPNKYDTTFTIPANSTFDYVFWRDAVVSSTNIAYDSLEVRPANTVLPYGIYISSTASITVVYDVICAPPGFNNPETMSLKGQNGFGLEFVCPQQTLYRNRTLGDRLGTPPGVMQPKQQIVIVATQSNTVVWITPRCNIVGHPANVTYSVLLPSAGSAYNCENIVQDTYAVGNNLSGSIVVANKPIAVTVSDDSVNSPFSSPSAPGYAFYGLMGCYDFIGDQIVPSDIVGKDYIVNRGQLYASGQLGVSHPGMKESAFIVATENFTQLTTINGAQTLTALMNKGDTYVDTLSQPLTYIHANKNIYVYHVSGIGCELGAAILPPLTCAGSKLVAFSRNTPQLFALNILCKNGSQGTFTLNASTTSITAANFTMVPGTATLTGGPFWGAQVNFNSIVTMPPGTYTIGNNSDEFALGVFDGGATSGGLFHYMSSFLRKSAVVTNTLPPVCVGQNTVISLTGTVSGGAISGLWTTNGSGTFGPYTSTNNVVSTTYSLSPTDTTFVGASATLQFYLTSSGECDPVSDTTFLTINQKPIVSVTSGSIMCKNNLLPIVLNGTVTNAITGSWSGGNGGVFGPLGPVSSYTPSQADLASNSITLSLTSAGPLPGCVNAVRSLTIGFADPPIVSAGVDRTVCTNSSTLDLNGSVGGTTNLGNWSYNGTGLFFPSSAAPSATYQFSQSDLLLTQLSLTLSSVFNATNNPANCAAESDEMHIFIIPKPTVLAPEDFTVCATSGAIALTGTVQGSAVTGSWTSADGTGFFTQQPPVNASYIFSQADTLVGLVNFVLNSYGGFCPSLTDTVKVTVLSRPIISVNPDNLPTCENIPIALTGSVTGYTSQGIWSSSGTGVFSPTNTVLNGQYFPSSNDFLNGNVVLTLTSFTLPGFQNCGSSKSFTTFFVDAPSADFSMSTARCLKSPVIFSDISQANGTGNLQYSWNFGDGGISTAINPIYTFTNTGSFLVTLTVTGTSTLVGSTPVQCPDVKDTLLTIKALPVADFSITSACQNLQTEFTNLSFTPPQTEAIQYWSWSFGDGKDTLTTVPTTTLVHTYTSSISFNAILTVTTTAGCVSEPKILPIDILPQPDAEFGMTNNPSVVEEPVYFSDFTTPTGTITKWFWEFGDQASSTFSAPVHSYQDAGIYSVTLTVIDDRGCKDVLSKSIEVTLLPQVPTGFSPNNDGNNDMLFVKGGPFVDITFRVYNNWGELVFETRDQSIGWDGKKNGVDQPVGVYVWTFVVDMYNNRQVKKNGDVTLIR